MNGGLRARIIGSFAALMFGVAAGSVGCWAAGAGCWALADCAYMTVITLTTVGYGELVPDFDRALRPRVHRAAHRLRHGHLAGRKDGGGYTCGPEADFTISVGMTLVVIGEIEDVAKLRQLAA